MNDPLRAAVSRVGFGAWAIGGTDWGAANGLDERRAAVHAALDGGVRLFDTAPTYGDGRSEEILGAVLGPVRDRVVIATKCGPRDEPARSLEDSLRRLGTDYVDLYQLHEVPEDPLAFEESLRALARLREEGVTRAVGLCNVTVQQLERALEILPVATVQNPYNLFDRDIEPRTLPFCRERGIGVLAYRPLASGLLTGKYREPPEFGSGDHRSRIYWFRGSEFRRRSEVVSRLEELAAGRDASVAQVALAWVLARPGVWSVLAGARGAEQVGENIGAASIELSEDEVAMIDGWVQVAFRPPRLHPAIEVGELESFDGDVEVTDRRTGRATSLGAREAFILRRLDGSTPYEEIAESWNEHSSSTLISAQVKVFVDQLRELDWLAPERKDDDVPQG